MQERYFLEVELQPREVRIGPRDLATDIDLIRTLKKMPDPEYEFFMTFLILSGRRGKDIEELTWDGIKTRNNSWNCILPRDKTNRNQLVSFVINFETDWDLNYDITLFKSWVENGIGKRTGRLFETIQSTKTDFKRSMITNKCDFKPHSIRNRKALVMLIKGCSEQTVMSKIGWADMKSILRYAKISIDFVRTFNNYTELVENLLNY